MGAPISEMAQLLRDLVEREGLRDQKGEVGLVDLQRRAHTPDLHVNVAGVTAYLEPARLDRRPVLSADDQRDVVSRLREHRPHVAAEPAGPDDDDPHASVTQPSDADETDRT